MACSSACMFACCSSSAVSETSCVEVPGRGGGGGGGGEGRGRAPAVVFLHVGGEGEGLAGWGVL